MWIFGSVISSGLIALLAAMPASSTYQLHNYGFGSGGSDNSASSSYRLNATTGEVSGTRAASSTNRVNSGNQETQQANVPPAPTFTNPDNYYNRLHFIINNGGNPSDATFVIAISSDDFVTTKYVQSDNTVGTVLGGEDRQTYASWGSGTGEDVIGLDPSTTYKIKVSAMHGSFTESAFGPTATAATVGSQLSFDIDVSASDTDTSPPFNINMGTLLASTITDSPQRIWLDFATNGASGGKIYISGQNAGLHSATRSHTISSASGDLSVLSEGFGAQSASVTQSAGGPLAATSPYNGSSQSVGVTDAVIREAYSSATPLSGGRASLVLKAKPGVLTPQATDYSEILTLIASASF